MRESQHTMAPAAVCKNWLKGTCRYGKQCRYGHGSGGTASQNNTAGFAIAPPLQTTPAAKKARRKFFTERAMMRNTGALLHTIDDLTTIQKPGTRPIEIEDCAFIASYNWCNSNDPVIFVPGSPARWTPPNLPHQVPKDNGQVFIDQNSHRRPSAPFDPFFKALLTMNPSFHMDDIALITDRNSLRKLLTFASGKVRRSWRIDVDIVGNSMFFTRWEQSQLQIITGARDSGYGHEFEKAFLRFDANLKESSGHHRLIRYNLGGINCLVRFEVDGYLDDGDTHTNLEDELTQEMSALDLITSSAEVQVVERGHLVDPSSILELKSRSAGSKMQEIIPQLWISQTQHLFIGRHKDGLVDVAPERINMRDHFADWETKNQQCLKNLVALIGWIREVAAGAKGGQCVLVCKMNEKPGVLKVYEKSGKGFFLPEGVKEWCWGRENGE